ncbi:2OG-Fe(II) oxygenase [Congregibacter variabilis]|uniref:2OG-Fe(II) oxygenase n=1 Tax=Congregibacter variabilis TaxID=3081200 RepID=A0ABZ0I6T9_9GAMM|nr:2OG-Fe(II) oxygenase [Congregibacter sp. IMCC43200]
MKETQIAQQIRQRIDASMDQAQQQWANPVGTSTRHFVVDDLLPEALIDKLSAAFSQGGIDWVQRSSFREKKKTFSKIDSIDPLVGAVTDAFHEECVLEAVARVTGFDGLQADPELYAGGISMMVPGDFLNPHIDNSHDSARARYRRLNLLYYVSPQWSKDCGGNLELWDAAVSKPVEIVSRCNRLVVMETNKTSWHSVNEVITQRNRCCVSNYYFSTGSPDGSAYYHVTSFLGRPRQVLRRAWGRCDNFLRQQVAVGLKISRGKNLSRYK